MDQELLFAAEHGSVPELDLHGAYGREVRHRLEEFLQHSFVAGDRAVRVIHGHGEGVLQREVITALRSHPLVDDWKPTYYAGAIAVVLAEK